MLMRNTEFAHIFIKLTLSPKNKTMNFFFKLKVYSPRNLVLNIRAT